ncbi:D-alanyl-D-alanine carboxypeptidase [Actinomadura sp. KC345]|uniref:D-alanyl-D-alanine carboxypeptidase family protein n=1 Tax=Actinomadura sp. KC345 TaxID=2530371 RepID=UPI00104CE62F|nr:serine hydrolase [Actinomadura sp. KC345]TDC54878.1 D-alanyl-D-alanine carboxypeptidase [Actinomadura sp. KC345]
MPAPGPWSVAWDGTAPPAAPAPVQEEKAGRGRRGIVVLVAALVLVAGLVTGQLVRPVPEPTVDLAITSSHAFPGQTPALPWPTTGQAVVHVEGLGTMGASGGSAPTPTASVAKVMTAYVYLRAHPLRPGEPGPVLTVSPQAAAQIPMRKRRGESILGVTANQRLTQRKALEALMVISANDVAHELARWDAGSVQAFVAKMNATARSLGMTSTTYTDPSGYDERTVSTAADQVKLLRAAMRLPAFAEIVKQPTYVPDDGGPPRQGGNYLLGQHGVIGGKTGYTDAAGGNFVFVARKDVQGVDTLIVGAVLGQDASAAAGAVAAAEQIVVAAANAMVAKTLAPKGANVARVDDGLGGSTPLRASAPVTVAGWPGLTVPVGVEGDPPDQAGSGARVGTLTAGAAQVPLELAQKLDGPSIAKRLIRLG